MDEAESEDICQVLSSCWWGEGLCQKASFVVLSGLPANSYLNDIVLYTYITSIFQKKIHVYKVSAKLKQFPRLY